MYWDCTASFCGGGAYKGVICKKGLPPCVTEPMPASVNTDLALAKTKTSKIVAARLG